MMRHVFTLLALAGTFVALIATSPAPRSDCTAETLLLIANTTCGPSGSLVVTGSKSCGITTAGAAAPGFPSTGYFGNVPGTPPSMRDGFTLERYAADGGLVTCDATPADGGFAMHCDVGCVSTYAPDAGTVTTCNSTCEGALTP